MKENGSRFLCKKKGEDSYVRKVSRFLRKKWVKILE